MENVKVGLYGNVLEGNTLHYKGIFKVPIECWKPHFSQPRCSISMVRSITIIPLRNKLPWNSSQVGCYLCNSPHPQTAKRPYGPGPNGTQRDPTPPSSDSSVQTSSQTSLRNHQSHHLSSAVVMAIMACPKTWWNLPPLLKRPATQWVWLDNWRIISQELMDVWKESLWCWETPTWQSCSTLEIGKNQQTKIQKINITGFMDWKQCWIV